MDDLLPLIPFDIGDWAVSKDPSKPHGGIVWLPPSHPWVRDTPEAKDAQKAYAEFGERSRD